MAGLFAFTELNPHHRTKVYRSNHFDAFTEYDDEKFLREFRMVKTEVKDLCELLKDDLVCRGARKCDLTVVQKVLISLKTLGSGSFQNTAKDFFGVSQPVVSKVLSQFVDAMVKVSEKFIYMPRNQDEKDAVKSGFYKAAGFPGVIGCIDGSHIPIIAPSEDQFANRESQKNPLHQHASCM